MAAMVKAYWDWIYLRTICRVLFISSGVFRPTDHNSVRNRWLIARDFLKNAIFQNGRHPGKAEGE